MNDGRAHLFDASQVGEILQRNQGALWRVGRILPPATVSPARRVIWTMNLLRRDATKL
jgi:hypothetical protein